MKMILLVNVIFFLSLIGTAQSQTAKTNDQEEVSGTISLIAKYLEAVDFSGYVY